MTPVDTSAEAVAELVRRLRVPGVGSLWANGELFEDAADVLAAVVKERDELQERLKHSVPISTDARAVFIDGPGDQAIDWDDERLKRAEAAEKERDAARADNIRLKGLLDHVRDHIVADEDFDADELLNDIANSVDLTEYDRLMRRADTASRQLAEARAAHAAEVAQIRKAVIDEAAKTDASIEALKEEIIRVFPQARALLSGETTMTDLEKMYAEKHFIGDPLADDMGGPATKVHDWRNHLGELAEIWPSLSREARMAVAIVAEDSASIEEWE